MKYRVLVVEDNEWWRRYICAELEQTRQWEVSGAASDGAEAVQQARDLEPDVILLDIGLPGLDGIQTGQRILADDPGSRLLFVTEQHCVGIAAAALGIGARGFILKSDVARDLLPAMDAVVGGERFITAKFGGRGVETGSDGGTAREIQDHEAVCYADESSLLDDHVRFVETALDAGNGLVMVFTRSRRDRLHQRLKDRGIDLDRIIREGRCHWIDVSAALSSFIVRGRVDEGRFWNAASALIMEAAKGSTLNPPRVSVCGDGAATLLQDDLADAAIQLEQRWDDVARAFNVDIFFPGVSERRRQAALQTRDKR